MVLAILIIVAAVLLMKSGVGKADKYEEYYSQAMELYIDGDFTAAAGAAQKALDESSTEEAVVLLAKCYYQAGDSTSAIFVLENWLSKNSGSEAQALLDEYKDGSRDEDGEELTIGGQKVAQDAETLSITGVALTSADLEDLAKLTQLTALTPSPPWPSSRSCARSP